LKCSEKDDHDFKKIPKRKSTHQLFLENDRKKLRKIKTGLELKKESMNCATQKGCHSPI